MNKTINRLQLARVLKLYKETPTTSEVLISEGDLAEGVEVFVEDANGELVVAGDGEYETPDGITVYVVKDGKVAEIRVKEEPAPEPEPEPEPEEMESEEPEPEGESVEELHTRIAELEADVAERDQRISELTAELDELKKRIAETEPPAEEKEKENKFAKETRGDKISRVLTYIKKK